MCIAVVGKIISIDDSLALAKVMINDVIKDVNILLIPEAKVNDYIIIHAGMGIRIIDKESVKTYLNLFDAYG